MLGVNFLFSQFSAIEKFFWPCSGLTYAHFEHFDHIAESLTNNLDKLNVILTNNRLKLN